HELTNQVRRVGFERLCASQCCLRLDRSVERHEHVSLDEVRTRVTLHLPAGLLAYGNQGPLEAIEVLRQPWRSPRLLALPLQKENLAGSHVRHFECGGLSSEQVLDTKR